MLKRILAIAMALMMCLMAATAEEMTVLPLVYRCGVLINNSPLKGLTPSCADPYYNIHTLG